MIGWTRTEGRKFYSPTFLFSLIQLQKWSGDSPVGKTFKAAHLIAIHHYPHKTKLTLDTQVSLAPSPVSLSVGPFGFPFCQHL